MGHFFTPFLQSCVAFIQSSYLDIPILTNWTAIIPMNLETDLENTPCLTTIHTAGRQVKAPMWVAPNLVLIYFSFYKEEIRVQGQYDLYDLLVRVYPSTVRLENGVNENIFYCSE